MTNTDTKPIYVSDEYNGRLVTIMWKPGTDPATIISEMRMVARKALGLVQQIEGK